MENQQIIDSKRERALNDVKMYMANDWELKEETPEYFLLTRRTWGFGKHLLLFIFTWWTFGIANLIAYVFGVQKKKILK